MVLLRNSIQLTFFLSLLFSQGPFNSFGIGNHQRWSSPSQGGIGSIGLVPSFQSQVSLSNPAKMMQDAKSKSDYPILKIKLGGQDDEKCIKAVREGSPNSRIIVDANEGWNVESYNYLVQIFKNIGVELIEQPFPSNKDHLLKNLDRKIPICADESCHDVKSLEKLMGLYDYINIKLDKTGGLTEAIILLQAAKKSGFKIMLGCMVGTSLAMAPALLLSGECDIVDLDGPLLLKKDRPNPIRYDDFLAFPISEGLWGV